MPLQTDYNTTAYMFFFSPICGLFVAIQYKKSAYLKYEIALSIIVPMEKWLLGLKRKVNGIRPT